MARPVFSAIESLDGHVADEASKFDFTEPDELVRTFVNDPQLQVGTCPYGRRMCEVMVARGERFDQPRLFPVRRVAEAVCALR